MIFADIYLLIMEQWKLAILLCLFIQMGSWILNKRGNVRYQSLLWLAYFFTLLVPWSSLLSLSSIGTSQSVFQSISLSVMGGGAGEASLTPEQASLWSDLNFSLIWAVGFFLSFIVFVAFPLFRQSRLENKLLEGSTTDSSVISPFFEKMGIPVLIVSDPTMVSPYVSGILNSRLYIPKYLSQPENFESLKLMLAHEESHIVRRDTLALMFARTVTCLFWFIPFCYWAYRKLGQAQEIVADQRALEGQQPVQTKDYAGMLVAMASSGTPKDTIGFTHAFFNYQNLTGRLQMIRDNRKLSNNSILQPIGVGLISLFMAVACTLPGKRESTGTQNLISYKIVVREGKEILARPWIQSREGEKATVIVSSKDEKKRKFALELVSSRISDGLINVSGDLRNGECTKMEWALKKREILPPCVNSVVRLNVLVKDGETLNLNGNDGITYEIKVNGSSFDKISEKVSVSLSNEKIVELFNKLTKQTKINFIIDKKVDLSKTVSIEVNQISLNRLLDVLSQSYDLEFVKSGSSIIKVLNKKV